MSLAKVGTEKVNIRKVSAHRGCINVMITPRIYLVYIVSLPQVRPIISTSGAARLAKRFMKWRW